MISTLFFFLQNDNKMRVMGNPTTVLEMYPHIKEIFIAGGCEVTIDDIKGFLQFPTILGPSLLKSILLKFSQRLTPHQGEVLPCLCHKFAITT